MKEQDNQSRHISAKVLLCCMIVGALILLYALGSRLIPKLLG